MTPEALMEVVVEGKEERLQLNPRGNRIRALYGHSIPVELEGDPVKPPTCLYHGTAQRNLPPPPFMTFRAPPGGARNPHNRHRESPGPLASCRSGSCIS